MTQTAIEKNKGAGRPIVEEITDAQRRTFQAIRNFIAEHGYSPTLKELSDELGIRITPVHDSIKHLIRKGYLKRRKNTPRSLAIVREPEEQRVSGFKMIPLIGTVAAGVPTLADAEVLGEAMVPASMITSGKHYALKVKGESMIDADIHDGDTVIVREQPLAEHGDIVVAMFDEDEDATLKRLYWKDEKVELRPENEAFDPIQITSDSEFRILGKVVTHTRQWN